MKKKVIYIHHYASNQNQSGLLRPYYLSKFNENLNVSVYCSSFMHYSHEQLINEKELYITEEAGHTTFYYIRSCGYNNTKKRVMNMIEFMINSVRVFSKTDKGNPPDVIVASSPHLLSLLSGLYLSKVYKIPLVTEIRDFWPEAIFINGFVKEKSILGKMLLLLEKKIYYNSDALIFLKPGDDEYLRERKLLVGVGGRIRLESCFYINNGIDYREFKEQKRDIILTDDDLKSNKKKIIYIGSIRKVNNLMLLVKAAESMQNIKDCIFLIYGDGNEKEEIENYILHKNIKNVKLKGRVNKEFVPYILSQANINILNYSQGNYNWKRGNSSNKLFEYIAAGKPILSTVKMGYSLIDEYEIGETMDENTSESMVRSILNLLDLNNEELNRIKKVSEKVIVDYDYRTLSLDFQKAIEFAISNKRNKSKKVRKNDDSSNLKL